MMKMPHEYPALVKLDELENTMFRTHAIAFLMQELPDPGKCFMMRDGMEYIVRQMDEPYKFLSARSSKFKSVAHAFGAMLREHGMHTSPMQHQFNRQFGITVWRSEGDYATYEMHKKLLKGGQDYYKRKRALDEKHTCERAYNLIGGSLR